MDEPTIHKVLSRQPITAAIIIHVVFRCGCPVGVSKAASTTVRPVLSATTSFPMVSTFAKNTETGEYWEWESVPFTTWTGQETQVYQVVLQDYNGDGDTIDQYENMTMWCWNGKSSGGLFDWQYCSVDLIDQIDMINTYSTASIDVDNDYFKVRFSYFYYGAGNGGGSAVPERSSPGGCGCGSPRPRRR